MGRRRPSGWRRWPSGCPAVLKGDDRPSDDAERLALAQMCYDTKRYAAAARLWAEALEADPKLGDDRQAQHRYNAACAAALAAAGQGKDDPPPDEAARAEAARRRPSTGSRPSWPPGPSSSNPARPRPAPSSRRRSSTGRRTPTWPASATPTALAKLPEAERKQWQALWAEVDALLARARGGL